MKILGIYGSPRKKGNSDLLLDRALDAVRESGHPVTVLRPSDYDISGCRGCGGCDQSGECVVRDVMQELYPMLDEADRIILSTPIFFYNIPSQLKALVDRSQSRWARRMNGENIHTVSVRPEKKGYLIAVGATKGKKLFEGVELTAKYFFDALGVRYGGGLFFKQVDKKGAIRDVAGALDQAYELGTQVVTNKAE